MVDWVEFLWNLEFISQAWCKCYHNITWQTRNLFGDSMIHNELRLTPLTSFWYILACRGRTILVVRWKSGQFPHLNKISNFISIWKVMCQTKWKTCIHVLFYRLQNTWSNCCFFFEYTSKNSGYWAGFCEDKAFHANREILLRIFLRLPTQILAVFDVLVLNFVLVLKAVLADTSSDFFKALKSLRHSVHVSGKSKLFHAISL